MWACVTPPSTARTHERTLGTIPPSIAPVVDQALEFRSVAALDSLVAGSAAVHADAVHVGQVDELGGPDGLGDGAGDRVGVDVVGLPGAVAAYGGHHRYEVLGHAAGRAGPG